MWILPNREKEKENRDDLDTDAITQFLGKNPETGAHLR